jgi:VanZ family protein
LAEEVTAQEAIPTIAIMGTSLLMGAVVVTTSASVRLKIVAYIAVVAAIITAYFAAYNKCKRALKWLSSKFKG